ncbi:hypothetical protein [Bdellovibrio bacteriovorus]|uniref:Ig-like domain-containing protein n=1 Tax=Bdellovibrio bacteriovorus TaxID=959 RepID=A0A1Z3N766_BDEBC|nr:hypothetical protein [Bdellovibrio bacteriovorus]ASD63287.1 hypothetical protein B9G79_06740 [Bdellovibrio bacteriovorus]
MDKPERTISLKTSRLYAVLLNSLRGGLLVTLLASCTADSLNWVPAENSIISGKIHNYSADSALSQKVSALSCAAPQVHLYKVDGAGNRMEPAVDSGAVAADGSFSVSMKSLGGSLLTRGVLSDSFLLQVTGCSSGLYLRPVTGSKEQDISMGSSLISYLMNTNQKDKMVEALKASPENVNHLITLLSTSSSLEEAYSRLTGDASVLAKFTEIFGSHPDVLASAAPEILDVTIPSNAMEHSAIALSVEALHWSSGYQIAYEWKLDGIILGSAKNISYTASANQQGVHELVLTVGESNGAGGLDTNRPTQRLVRSLVIGNNVLPVAPTMAITLPLVSGSVPISTRSVIVTINTGAALSGCESFSSLLLTEEATAPTATAVFPILCTQPGGQDVPFNLASAGDGLKNIYLWAKDSAGVVSQVPSVYGVRLDTTAPTALISTSVAVHQKSSTQSFAFTGDDGGGVIERFDCKLDTGAWTACSSPISYSGLGQGHHSFSVRAVDTAGNSSAVVSKSWNVDLTAPVLSLVSTPASITNSLSATFELAASDVGGSLVSVYQCSIDNAAFADCPGLSSYVVTAGTHNFRARALDGAGNISGLQSYTWTVDTAAPVTTISAKPPTLTNAMTASFSFSATDSGGGSIASYFCELDGAGFSACSSGKSYSGLLDGGHIFKVRARDTAGNDGVAVSYSWTINTSTPMASISHNPEPITKLTTASFEFAAVPPPGGSIVGYQCSLNGGTWAACSSPKNYSALSAGSQQFSVRSVDNNSNVSTAAVYNWLIDTTAPVLSVSSAPAPLVNSTEAQFVFAGTDSGGAGLDYYLCQLDGGPFGACVSPKNFSNLAAGAHSFNVKAVDAAGNESAVQSKSWTVDVTAPTLTLNTFPTSVTNLTTASFTFAASDVGGGTVAGYTCRLDTAAAASCASGVSFSSLTAGTHTFEVFAVDSVGNTSEVTSYTWTVDLTPPTLTITSKPAEKSNTVSPVFAFSASDTGGGTVLGYQCKLDGGAYNACSSPWALTGLSQGNHTVSIYAVDSAGNSSAAGIYTWTVDTVAPVISVTTPVANGFVVPSSNVGSYSVGGTCSEEGTAVVLSGVTSASAPCTGAVWGATIDLSAMADGIYSLQAAQTDAAGNTFTTVARTFVKDTTGPVINVASMPSLKGGSTQAVSWTMTEANPAAGSSFNVEVYNGTAWSSVGTKIVTAGANSATAYVLTTAAMPVVSTDQARVRVTFVDAAANSTTANSNPFIIDSLGPVLSSLTVNGGLVTSGNNNIPVALTAADSLTDIQKICLQTSHVPPTSTHNCWVNISAYGVNPGKNINPTSLYFNVGLVSGSYPIYVWLMDAVGNISTNTGTAIDYGSVTYNSPTPPVIQALQVTSTDTPSSPPTKADLTVGSGSPVYVKWKVASTVGLSASAIKVSYTTDDTTFGGGPTGSYADAVNGSCSLDGGYTGCVVLSAPAATYFKVRVQITDLKGFITMGLSQPLNSSKVSFLAGNTDLGLGSSAKSAVILPDTNYGLAVLDDGRIFVIDTRGLAWVNPVTGVYEIIATKAASSSGDGGVLSNAKFSGLTGIWADNNNDLLIADGKRLRKVNTKADPMTISTLLGGGGDASDSVAIATNYNPSSNISRLSISPNGDIYFRGEGTSGKIRKYKASTGAISTVTISGVGNTFSATQDNASCGYQDYGVTFDSSGNADSLIMKVQSTGASGACPYGDTSEWKGYAQANPVTGAVKLPAPNWVVTAGRRETMKLYNSKGGDLYYASSDRSVNGKAIYRFNRSTLGWDRVYGANAHGTCADGSSADTCAIAASSLAFNSQGQIFYVDGKTKSIRTIDGQDKIRTLAGDSLGSEDGTKGSLVRFAGLTDVKLQGTDIYLFDLADARIRKIPIGGNVSTVAGNQVSGEAPDSSVAAEKSIHVTGDSQPGRFIIDELTGDIYYPRSGSLLARIVKATGLWEDVTTKIYGYGPLPYGIGNGHILVNTFSYSGTLGHVNSYMSIVNISTKASTKIVYPDNGSNVVAGSTFCADGATLKGSCNAPGLRDSGNNQGKYDVATGKWLAYENTTGRVVIFDFNGAGVIETLIPLGRGIRGLETDRNVGLSKNNLYVCGTDGKIYKYDLNNSNQMTELPLPNTTMTCTGQLHYSESRNKLMFQYSQNGLGAVAEYDLNP